MAPGFESVTVGVVDLDGALAQFRGIRGLRQESDANASVSQLAAWRYPVHADVRLVELACEGCTGRVRLARFDPACFEPNMGAGPGGFEPAKGDDAVAKRFYEDGLGMAADFDRGLSEDLLAVVRRLAHAESISVPAAMPGHPGINLISLSCDDLDALEARLRELEAEIITRPTHVALGSGTPTRVLLARGPRHELLEFIERGA